MPKRTDIESILVIGSGPIVIGQACEFDYSGTQACRVLRAEGYRVILVNSNPATIMTDPELADATYVEPLDLDTLTRVIEKERPDALLPTLGGQTALNLAIAGRRGRSARPVRCRADRRRRRGDPHRRGPAPLQGGHDRDRPVGPEVGHRLLPGGGPGRRRGDRLPVDLPAVVHPRRRRHGLRRRRTRSWRSWRPTVSPPARWGRSSSSSRSPGGRSTSSRSCATAQITQSWSVPSRTSTRWALTPATRSPWRPPRPSPTSSTRRCAMPPSPASAASASRPAAPTSSSPSTPPTGRWSSSR